MMIRTTLKSETMSEQEEIDLKDFAQYLHNISFDDALHRVRRMSWESIIDKTPQEVLALEMPEAN